jgi:hypothetical protein
MGTSRCGVTLLSQFQSDRGSQGEREKMEEGRQKEGWKRRKEQGTRLTLLKAALNPKYPTVTTSEKVIPEFPLSPA